MLDASASPMEANVQLVPHRLRRRCRGLWRRAPARDLRRSLSYCSLGHRESDLRLYCLFVESGEWYLDTVT